MALDCATPGRHGGPDVDAKSGNTSAEKPSGSRQRPAPDHVAHTFRPKARRSGFPQYEGGTVIGVRIMTPSCTDRPHTAVPRMIAYLCQRRRVFDRARQSAIDVT